MSTLIGVGVGPGDAELVTVKAVRVLNEADLVVVPVLDTAEPGRAEATVRAHLAHDRLERVTFALNERTDRARREAAWDAAARRVAEAFGAGARTVAFATIGDPAMYSTFTYLTRTVTGLVPGTNVETVPGITAMQDLAARGGTVLCEGTETLALVPSTAGAGRLRAALAAADTVVTYKAGPRLGEVRAALAESGRLHGAVYGARLGLPGEDIRPLAAAGDRAPYLATIIAPAVRTGRGGKL